MNIMNYATREVVTVAPDASVDHAISVMEEFNIHHLVVAANGEVLGILSDRDVLLSTGWMLNCERMATVGGRAEIIGPTRVDQIMARHPITLTNSSDALDAARRMVEYKIGALPVMHLGRLIGLVAETDLLRWLSDLGFGGNAADRLLSRPVRDLMRAHVFTVGPEATVGDIIDLFRRHRVRHVPVLDSGEVLGIVSDRDVRRALGWSSVREAQADEAGELFDGPRRATDVMTANVRTCNPDATLRAALAEMLEHRIHSLPVVQGGALQGILTQTDYIRAIAREEAL